MNARHQIRNFMPLQCALLLPMACAAVMQVHAQSSAVQSFSPEQIRSLESTLHAQASASHAPATGPLAKYPGFFTMLVVRTSNGEAELHRQFDEIMIVTGGHAAVITGGTANNPRTTAPGELRGVSIRGGSRADLLPNAVVHIPAGTPHQVFVPAGGSITYIDVKVAHSNQR